MCVLTDILLDFWHRVSYWPGTHQIGEAGNILRDLLVPASQVLSLEARVTIYGSFNVNPGDQTLVLEIKCFTLGTVYLFVCFILEWCLMYPRLAPNWLYSQE